MDKEQLLDKGMLNVVYITWVWNEKQQLKNVNEYFWQMTPGMPLMHVISYSLHNGGIFHDLIFSGILLPVFSKIDHSGNIFDRIKIETEGLILVQANP